MTRSVVPERDPAPTMSRALITLFAFCCGAIVANIYYAQPIIGLIAPDIHLSAHGASLIVSLTQIGYALGLFFLVPLADLMESRKLMLGTALLATISLIAASQFHEPVTFLLLSLLIGFSSVSVQMLIPLSAHLSSEASRGRVVGTIMGGLLLGILLARPLASVIADYFGWRAVFAVAAVVMLLIMGVMAATVPARLPDHRTSYAQLLRSLGTLFVRHRALRQRAFYQGLMFAAFSLFWTAVPIELSRRHGLSQSQIAIFALVGAVGAIAAPIAGRLADAGHTRRASLVALVLAPLSFTTALIHPAYSVVGLALTGVLLDFAVQMSMVLGQRTIYGLDPASRGRLNALYMTSIFLGGAIGSAAASSIYEQGGWPLVLRIGSAIPLVALIGFVINDRRSDTA
jgi:predicted MFS family arabinose efflux permease